MNNKANETIKLEKNYMKKWLSWNAKLYIPIYQRKYEWNEDNIQCLIDDIKSRIKDNNEHYFGIIAQKQELRNNNDSKRIKIIDGQQRITTSILLLCVCRDIAIDRSYKKNKNEIEWYEDLLKEQYKNKDFDEYIINPGGTEENNMVFQKIILGEIKNIDKKYKTNKYLVNYKTMYKILDDEFKNYEDIENFINVFLNNFLVASISFDSDIFNNKKEMEVFENLNSKGLELSIADLVKNHLFNYCDDALLNISESEIPLEYNSVLSSIGIDDKSLEEFYLIISEIFVGFELEKNKNKRFSIISKQLDEKLFSEYTTIKSINDFKKMMSLFKYYLKLFNDLENNENNSDFMNKLNCSHIFSIISNNKKRKLFFYFSFLIYQLICKKNNVKYFDISDNNYNLNKDEIKSIQQLFLTLCTYLIKNKILVSQGDSSIKRNIIEIVANYQNKIFNNEYNEYSIINCCNQINNELKLKSNLLDKNEIYNKLGNIIDNELGKEILLLIELYMSNNFENKNDHITRKIATLEHIMPENRDKWIEAYEWNCSQQEYDNYKSKLGNYLILTKSNNSKLRDSLFEDKQKFYDENIISMLYRNGNDDIDISRKTKWNFLNIENRTKALIDYIKDKKIFE